MIALACSGYDVVGFDASRDLVEAGRANVRQAGVSGSIHLAGPGAVPADIGQFDALVVGRGVYHHIARASRRIDFLAGCRRLLAAGAFLALGDVLFTE